MENRTYRYVGAELDDKSWCQKMAGRVDVDETDRNDSLRTVQRIHEALVIADRDQLTRVEQQVVASGQKVGIVENGGSVVDKVVVFFIFRSVVLDQRGGRVVFYSQLKL